MGGRASGRHNGLLNTHQEDIPLPSKIIRFFAALALLAIGTLAQAQISAKDAERLLKVSGTWNQLGDLVGQTKAGIRTTPNAGNLPPSALAELDKAVDVAFAPALLRSTSSRVLMKGIRPAQLADALVWYDSATGKLMTSIEEAWSAKDKDYASLMADGNAELEQSSPQRRELLTRIVQLTYAAEATSSIQINSAIGVIESMSAAASAINGAIPIPKAKIEKMRQAMESQKPQMVNMARGVMLSLFALMYQPVSDEELGQYVGFLSSQSGGVICRVFVDALEQSVIVASKTFGRTLIKSKTEKAV